MREWIAEATQTLQVKQTLPKSSHYTSNCVQEHIGEKGLNLLQSFVTVRENKMPKNINKYLPPLPHEGTEKSQTDNLTSYYNVMGKYIHKAKWRNVLLILDDIKTPSHKTWLQTVTTVLTVWLVVQYDGLSYIPDTLHTWGGHLVPQSLPSTQHNDGHTERINEETIQRLVKESDHIPQICPSRVQSCSSTEVQGRVLLETLSENS